MKVYTFDSRFPLLFSGPPYHRFLVCLGPREHTSGVSRKVRVSFSHLNFGLVGDDDGLTFESYRTQNGLNK